MAKILKQQDFVVDLSEGIFIRTPIPSSNHAALRSGFAGLPANPRWTVDKFRAWKTGRQLRDLLVRKEMIVRHSDSMLVLATSQTEKGEEKNTSSFHWQRIWEKLNFKKTSVFSIDY